MLFGPRPPTTVATWEQAKDGFNFGTVEVDRRGRLTAGFVNTAGQTSVLPHADAAVDEDGRAALTA